MNGEKWLIWSIEHNAWWAPNNRGYVTNVKEAGRYTYKTAAEIIRGANYSTTVDPEAEPNEAMILDRKEYQ